MKSTGEVMAIDYSFGLAFYKAQIAAGNKLPLHGRVLFSISDREKNDFLLETVKKYLSLGFECYATEGTFSFLKKNGINKIKMVKKEEAEKLIRKGFFNLVIIVPTKCKKNSSGKKIRMAVLETLTPYFTTLDGAYFAAIAIEEARVKKFSIKRIDEY